MAVSLAKRICEKTNESKRKCFYWAVLELNKQYEIKNI